RNRTGRLPLRRGPVAAGKAGSSVSRRGPQGPEARGPTMRRILSTLLLSTLLAATASAASAEEWHSEQPRELGISVPVPPGVVGDIEFWAPNRGMLITAGNDAISAGLYAYDGTSWYPYSTVCGGHEGRIAWAGPNDFWTIADQQKGQQTGKPPAEHI